MEQSNKYKVIEYVDGLYESDTISIKVGKQIIQIPITKGLHKKEDLVGKYVILESTEPILKQLNNISDK